MKRIGYDADSSRYYFQDSDGSFWRGPEGSEFGELTRGVQYPTFTCPHITEIQAVAELPSHIAGGGPIEYNDLEAAPTHSNGYQLLGADADVRDPHPSFYSNPKFHPTVHYGSQTSHQHQRQRIQNPLSVFPYHRRSPTSSLAFGSFPWTFHS
jgi:hypothetical protein